MIHQITKDLKDGHFYLIPTISIFHSKPLSMLLINFKFLNIGYTYHHRKKRLIRYESSPPYEPVKHKCYHASEIDCRCKQNCQRLIPE